MADNTLRFAVTLDDSGAIKGFRNLKAAASSAGGSVGTSFGTAGAAVSRLEKGLGSAGGALGHAKSQVMGLAGSVGLLAGGAGLLGLGGLLKESTDRVMAFAETVDKGASITGLAVDQMSRLAGALTYFEIPAEKVIPLLGKAEKGLGMLTETQKKAADFQKTYGLSLVDSGGKVKDMNRLLLDSADYYNNAAIPAQVKAAAMAKLYGKTWTDLVEVFEKGSPAIRAAEEQAAKLGLTVNDATIADFLKMRDATREWNLALGGLELQIGTALLPAMTGLTKSATEFVSGHRADIVGFFKNAADAAKQVGGVVTGTVIPAFQKIVGAFQSLPEPVRQLLIGGFVGNKVVKWTFGIDAAGLGVDLVQKLVGAALGRNIQAAVVNVQGAVVNGGGGLPGVGGGAAGGVGAAEGAGAAGIGGTLASLAPLAIGIGGILAAYWLPQILADKSKPGEGQVTSGAGTVSAGAVLGIPDATARSMHAYGAVGNLLDAKAATTLSSEDSFNRLKGSPVDTSSKGLADAVAGAIRGLATAIAKPIETGSERSARLFTAALDRVSKRAATDNQKFVVAQLKTAQAISKGSGSADRKADQLRAVQANLLKHGDSWAAKQVAYLLDIARKPVPSLTVNVTGAGVSVAPVRGSNRKPVKLAAGSWRTGHELAELHPDEMVLPAQAATAVRQAFSGSAALAAAGARTGGPSSSVVEFHLHVHGASTPGAMSEAAQAFGPTLVRWMQRNGVLPRAGSPMLG